MRRLSNAERRRLNINNATPEGTLKGHIEANERQILDSGILSEIPEDHVLSDMFRRDGANYQVHHIVPARTYEGLYANTDEEGKRLLTDILHGGNSRTNLFITPNRSHNGIKGISEGIHTRLKDKGLQVGGSVVLQPLIQRMENAANLPLERKLQIAQEFVDAEEGGRQEFFDILNDVLSENESWAHQNRSQAKAKAQLFLEKAF